MSDLRVLQTLPEGYTASDHVRQLSTNTHQILQPHEGRYQNSDAPDTLLNVLVEVNGDIKGKRLLSNPTFYKRFKCHVQIKGRDLEGEAVFLGINACLLSGTIGCSYV